MTTFTVREASRRDVPAISTLWKEMMDYHGARDPRFTFAPNAPREFEHHLISTMRSQGARVYVAEAEEQIIGYIIGEVHGRKPIYPVGVYGFVSDISVREDWRREGVGRALFETLLAWFHKNRATCVELFVAEENPVSTAFWQAMGFGPYLRLLRREIEP